MLTWIVGIIIVGTFITIFHESSDGRIWPILKTILLFIPLVIIATLMHVFGDFKNHRLGYIMIFLIIAIVGWGMYMGLKAGPASPMPWDSQ